jgi:hypothetical protein
MPQLPPRLIQASRGLISFAPVTPAPEDPMRAFNFFSDV